MTAGAAATAQRTTVPSLCRAMLLVAAVATVAAVLGIGVPALQSARVAVDEEQYVLSAISLAEDGDLDITDELREQRWHAFADVQPHVETVVLPNGTQISPHDPLLPLLLAGPAWLAGRLGVADWVGMKVALSLLAGVLAALLLCTAVNRFGVAQRTAVVGVAVAGASMPLAVYGQQIYPELPAALVTLLGVLALTGPAARRWPRDRGRPSTSVPKCAPRAPGESTLVPKCGPEAPGDSSWARECGALRRRDLVLLGVVVSVLPWLSVKYSLVAFALAMLGAVRAWRAGQPREVAVLGGVLAAMGVAYLVVHRLVWGGWTAYASGEHFAQTGEFAVVGVDPDYVDRALRIIGLLLDRQFGLVPWQPAWLLLVPAVAALLAARRGAPNAGEPRVGVVPGPPAPTAPEPASAAAWPPYRAVLLWPLAGGWFVATFVALTMHGYWFPGRQVVVVLPLAVLAVLAWLERAGPAVRRVASGLGLAGVLGYVTFLVEGYLHRVTWVVHFVDSDHPVYRLLGPVLTTWRDGYRWPHLAGLAVVVVLAWWGVRSARSSGSALPGGADLPGPAVSRVP